MTNKEANRIAAIQNPHYMIAYREIKLRFNLLAAQRDQLDASPFYVEIMDAAHVADWGTVADLLRRAEIVR